MSEECLCERIRAEDGTPLRVRRWNRDCPIHGRRKAFRLAALDCPVETYVRFLPRNTPCPVCGASWIMSIGIENRGPTELLNSYWSTWCDACEARNATAAEARHSIAQKALDDLVAETEALGLYEDEP